MEPPARSTLPSYQLENFSVRTNFNPVFVLSLLDEVFIWQHLYIRGLLGKNTAIVNIILSLLHGSVLSTQPSYTIGNCILSIEKWNILQPWFFFLKGEKECEECMRFCCNLSSNRCPPETPDMDIEYEL